LTFKPKDAAVNVRLAQNHSSIVRQVSCREVVSAVNDDVVIAHDLQRIFGSQPFRIGLNLHIGVQVLQPLSRRFNLWNADDAFAVKDLPLQVRSVNDIKVN
jgi:hypothetical protein